MSKTSKSPIPGHIKLTAREQVERDALIKDLSSLKEIRAMSPADRTAQVNLIAERLRAWQERHPSDYRISAQASTFYNFFGSLVGLNTNKE
jgi:hypothetical protein